MTTKAKVVLQKNVFDALELSALIHGGIGEGCLSRIKGVGAEDPIYGFEDHVETPACIIGHGLFLDGYGFFESDANPGESPVLDELVRAFPALLKEVEVSKEQYSLAEDIDRGAVTFRDTLDLIENVNDTAVSAFGKCVLGTPTLTWKQWCKRLNVVRGDA